MVRAYKGSHSGEHGDGIVRSEFHAFMFGERLVSAFEDVKDRFDPKGLFNPGKIVRAPKFDDRRLFRYGPDYRADEMKTHLDWSAYPGQGGGFQGAVEMCNNNGACRALAGGVMCPSYRVTREERDVTRGRANTLRLAITGQLGPDALASDEMAETLKLCVSCKACRRECPTGVDMARMKIEVQAARIAKHGLSLHDRLVGYLPRYAPWAARFPGSPTCATRCRCWRGCRRSTPASARGGSCRSGARIGSGRHRRQHGRRPRGRALRRHLQPLFRAGEPPRRGRRCSKPPAAACICRSRRTDRSGRCAAGARSCRSVSSIRRARKPSARSRR